MISNIRSILWRIRQTLEFAPGAFWIALACVACFLAQGTANRTLFAYGYSYGNVLTASFAVDGLFWQGFLWQPFTYLFLHGSWWHLAVNLLTLLFFGTGVERIIGTKRFLQILFTGGAVGGLCWLLCAELLAYVPLGKWAPAALAGMAAQGGSVCVGLSGGVFSLMGAYAALFPEREVFLLLFFVIPLRMKARTMAVLLGIGTILEAILLHSQVAYAAHLAGGIAGWLLAKRKWRKHYVAF